MQQSFRSFRIVCRPKYVPFVEDLLQTQGFRFVEEPFSPFARRLEHEPFPLGSSLAAQFGYIYIQDRSSMLPPLALAPAAGSAVLDMCASPGSKTGFLGQLAGPEGFILGNEPSKTRLATLRRNLQLLNLMGCCTTSYQGEQLPLHDGSWDAIQLDPPCSGWGTVEKNPQVLELWQGDKVKPLIAVQQRLLQKAHALLRPGGKLVYSTCTTNIEENEEQLRYATQELGFQFLPLKPFPGFTYADSLLPDYSGALRIETGDDGQGFFVALLQKPEDTTSRLDSSGAQSVTEQSPVGQWASDAAMCDGSGARHGISERHRSEMDEEDAERKGDGLKTTGTPQTFSEVKGGFFQRPWEKESRFVGERRRHGKSRNKDRERQKPEAELIPRSVLEECFADASLLPAGEIASFNGTAHFLPHSSAALIPDACIWKGFPLGKTGKDGLFRLNQHLRALMPSLGAAEERGLSTCSVEETEPLLSLISGQGLAVSPGKAGAPFSEQGLYYKELPLCRLSIKGSRAVLPPW